MMIGSEFALPPGTAGTAAANVGHRQNLLLRGALHCGCLRSFRVPVDNVHWQRHPIASYPHHKQSSRKTLFDPRSAALVPVQAFFATAGFSGAGGSGGLLQTGSACSFDAATAVGFNDACPQAVSSGSFA